MAWYKKLGPGLLYAGAAIGVSHLVQATRAGALYAFDLALVVLVINLIKYPFFEVGTRFVSATGQNLLQGYYKIHPLFLLIFLLQTFFTMFIVQSAVTVVTAGILINFLGLSLSLEFVCFGLFALLSLVLVQGKLSYLDRAMKPIILLLVLCTCVAFVMAFAQTKSQNNLFISSFDWLDNKDLVFLAALVGWMPSPLDGSVWHSVWAADKMKESKEVTHVKDALFDLRFSYLLIIVLALMFLSLGALVMHANGQNFSAGAINFSSELIGLYRASLGPWSSFVVSFGCLMIMISTTLSCWDAFARTMTEGSFLLAKKRSFLNYHFYLILIFCGSLFIISHYFSNMKTLVDFATTVAFLVAPLIALLSLALLFRKRQPSEVSVFPLALKVTSVVSTLFLLLSSAFYLLYL